MNNSKLLLELLYFSKFISRKELKKNEKLRRNLRNLRMRVIELMEAIETEGVYGRDNMLSYLDKKALLQN